MQNKPNLQNDKTNVSSCLRRIYENVRLTEVPKTNPKQTQFKPNFKTFTYPALPGVAQSLPQAKPKGRRKSWG